MSVDKFKKWMKERDKTVIKVAHESGYHFNTIYRYLAGKRVQPSTVAGLERLIDTKVEPSKTRSARS